MSRPQTLSPGVRMKRDSEARLRGLVPPEETITAVGTAEELHKLGPDIGSGAGWTFVVVTAVRVLFVRWASRRSQPECIRLDEVSRWADGKQYNCYVLVLTHPPMIRREHVVAHRFLWFKWGDAQADVTRTQTIFRFSRPETKATQAMRVALKEASVPRESVRFKERSRAERSSGGRVFATRR